MDPIPLSTVRAAVAADTVDTAVAAPFADIAGIAAHAWAAIAGAAADSAFAAADARATLAGAAADTAIAGNEIADNDSAAANSVVDLYRRAYRVCHHCGLHVPRTARSGRRFWL